MSDQKPCGCLNGLCEDCDKPAPEAPKGCASCAGQATHLKPGQTACSYCETPFAKPAPAPSSVTPASDEEIATEWAKEILGWTPRLKAATPGMFDAARGIMAKDARIEQEKAANAESRAASDRFEAESEQKGADLMACEGTLEEYKADNQRLMDRLGEVMSRAGLVCIAKDNEREKAIEELRAILAKGDSHDR